MRLMHERDGGTIYLPWGSEKEKIRAESLSDGLPYVRVCDKMNLMQAAELLQDAAGVVGVDTGLLHLANAFDKPLVGIYTDTAPEKPACNRRRKQPILEVSVKCRNPNPFLNYCCRA
ncbi:hypothetical protein NEIELOOT_02875 [Neisseria elongata subsp. glycolytica ATCC 29315]|uniref:Lipopolysaccharide heptosyltransferase I n=1 Tax=Neisseria elongata subsp. glycolytica ATCC 29315 TaxID=546263 RepID=D4DUW2_NEIEG|nr:hypothetical protein NEIELOOT_02875 [Neisseria elongata subsp. glycolytica ATCC 29315]